MYRRIMIVIIMNLLLFKFSSEKIYLWLIKEVLGVEHERTSKQTTKPKKNVHTDDNSHSYFNHNRYNFNDYRNNQA